MTSAKQHRAPGSDSRGAAGALRTLWMLCLAALVGCGGGEAIDGLRKHRDPDLSFMYPESWELTHDTFELETPDSRVLILRAPGDAVVMIHRFMPAPRWTLREFASEFSAQRDRRLAERGAGLPLELATSKLSLAPRGRPLEGLRQDYELERDGVRSQQTSLYFDLERNGAQVFVSAHAPRPRMSDLADELKTVLSSIRGGSLGAVGSGDSEGARPQPRPAAASDARPAEAP